MPTHIRRHEQTLLRLIDKGLKRKAVKLPPEVCRSKGGMIKYINSSPELADQMDNDSFLLIDLDDLQKAGKVEKVKVYYERDKNKKCAFFNVELSDFKPVDKVVPHVRKVTYLHDKGEKGKFFSKPTIQDEKMSDEEIRRIIMEGFEECRKPKKKIHPYILEVDDALRDDKGTFGKPMSKLGTPLSEIVNEEKSTGLTIPYRFVGTKYSVFMVHIEDYHGINSYNENIMGAFKVWIIVKKAHYEKLMVGFGGYISPYYAKEGTTFVKVGEGPPQCLLLHKSTWIDPLLLLEMDIEFEIVIQRAGQAVITGPRAFHQGFNGGSNFAVAVNLIMDSYLLNLNKSSMTCICKIKDKKDGYNNLNKDQFAVLEKARDKLKKKIEKKKAVIQQQASLAPGTLAATEFPLSSGTSPAQYGPQDSSTGNCPVLLNPSPQGTMTETDAPTSPGPQPARYELLCPSSASSRITVSLSSLGAMITSGLPKLSGPFDEQDELVNSSSESSRHTPASSPLGTLITTDIPSLSCPILTQEEPLNLATEESHHTPVSSPPGTLTFTEPHSCSTYADPSISNAALTEPLSSIIYHPTMYDMLEPEFMGSDGDFPDDSKASNQGTLDNVDSSIPSGSPASQGKEAGMAINDSQDAPDLVKTGSLDTIGSSLLHGCPPTQDGLINLSKNACNQRLNPNVKGTLTMTELSPPSGIVLEPSISDSFDTGTFTEKPSSVSFLPAQVGLIHANSLDTPSPSNQFTSLTGTGESHSAPPLNSNTNNEPLTEFNLPCVDDPVILKSDKNADDNKSVDPSVALFADSFHHLMREPAGNKGPTKKKCTKCDKLCHSSGMARHMRTHDKKTLNCKLCDKTFKNKENLQQHQFTHAEIPTFKCVKCGKMFKHPSHLSGHKKSCQA